MGAEGEPTCQGGGGGRGGEGGAGDSSRSAPSSCGIGCVGGEQSAITSCDSFFLFLLLDLVSCETSSKARDRAGSNGGGIVARAIEVAAGSAAGVAASAAASGAAAAAGGAVAAAAGVAAAAAAGAAASSAGASAAGPTERVNDGCDCWLLGLSCSCCLGASPATTSCCCTGVAAAAVLLSRAWHHLKRFSWRFLFCRLLFLLLSLCAPAAAVAAAIGRKSKVTCSPSGSCSKVTLAQKPALTNIIRWVLAEHYRDYRLY